jgi:HlyD family secretion protein
LKSQRLDAVVFAYMAAQSKKLRAAGLVSDEALKAAEVAAQKATIDAEQLEADIATAKKTSTLKLAGLALDLATLRRERDEAAHELELATAKADRDGVVTWTVLQEGTTVRRGDVLARVAGLESFRVEATVSDVHSARLRPGLAARVLVDGQTLVGTLTGIYPTIENGAVRFRVDLAEPKNQRLRNNLRVDVQIETGASADGLKLHRGPGIAGGEQEVYVVRGNRAERRMARFGVSGTDDVEVVAGLVEGDEVVISNLEQFRGVDVLKLR